MKLRVLRAFLIKGGARQEPGSVLELADAWALELIQMGKAVAVGPVPAVTGPMTTESTSGLVKGAKPSRRAAKE